MSEKSHMKNIVDEAIDRARADTTGTEADAFLRQCCGRVWMIIRDKLREAGQDHAANLVQGLGTPEYVLYNGIWHERK